MFSIFSFFSRCPGPLLSPLPRFWKSSDRAEGEGLLSALIPPAYRRWVFHNYAEVDRRQQPDAEYVRREDGNKGEGSQATSTGHMETLVVESFQPAATSSGRMESFQLEVTTSIKPFPAPPQAGGQGAEEPSLDNKGGSLTTEALPDKLPLGLRQGGRLVLRPGSPWVMVQQAMRDGSLGNLIASKQYSVVSAMCAGLGRRDLGWEPGQPDSQQAVLRGEGRPRGVG